MAARKSEKLRIGLILESFSQPKWIFRLVREIADSTFAEVALVIRTYVVQNGPGLVWQIYLKNLTDAGHARLRGPPGIR